MKRPKMWSNHHLYGCRRRARAPTSVASTHASVTRRAYAYLVESGTIGIVFLEDLFDLPHDVRLRRDRGNSASDPTAGVAADAHLLVQRLASDDERARPVQRGEELGKRALQRTGAVVDGLERVRPAVRSRERGRGHDASAKRELSVRDSK